MITDDRIDEVLAGLRPLAEAIYRRFGWVESDALADVLTDAAPLLLRRMREATTLTLDNDEEVDEFVKSIAADRAALNSEFNWVLDAWVDVRSVKDQLDVRRREGDEVDDAGQLLLAVRDAMELGVILDYVQILRMVCRTLDWSPEDKRLDAELGDTLEGMVDRGEILRRGDDERYLRATSVRREWSVQ